MFKNIIILLTIVLFSFHIEANEDLKFENILFNRDTVEISGLVKYKNELLMVGDKLSNRAIYKIIFEKDRFYYKDYIDLSKLNGHSSYFAKSLLFKHAGKLVKSPFDLEGITFCQETFYLVNEQVRHILKVEKNKLSRLELNFEQIFKKNNFPLEKISTNAGFEGIVADCKNQKLYIAQERSPRAIIQVNLKTSKVEDMFLIDNSNTKHGSQDFADLYYEKDHLYLLKRNTHQITKYNLKTKKEVKTFNFGNTKGIHLREIYETGEPYGLAEGLAVTEDRIYIGIDNNKNKISSKAQKTFGIAGNFSSILIYSRPKSF